MVITPTFQQHKVMFLLKKKIIYDRTWLIDLEKLALQSVYIRSALKDVLRMFL